MKKSVILTIAVIYILAIVIVGFLGIKMKVYNEKVYVKDIIVLTDGYQEYTDDTNVGKDKIEKGINGYIKNTFKEGLKVEIKCQVIPDNATEKKLDYTYLKKDESYIITIQDDGTAVIEFKKPGVLLLTVNSTDNAGAKKTIEIMANNFDY